MSPTVVLDPPPVTARLLRSLLGSLVTVDTGSATLHGTLLSCVKGSAWLVCDDIDVLVHTDTIRAVRPH
jgi:hypothetical protein